MSTLTGNLGSTAGDGSPATDQPDGLAMHDVCLRFGDGDDTVLALDEVALTVAPGEFVAVVGPSGAGKSSLLAVAGALITPEAGRVVVADVDVAALDARGRDRLRLDSVGFVFQQPNLLPSLTAAEQLQVMAQIDGRKPRSARDRAAELLDAVGLTDQAGRRPHQLSGGQRQRINIARALMNDPIVLLVDEPTSALDHERGAAVIDLITGLTHRQATATVLVTHDRAHLTAVDRIAEVHDGRLRLPAAAP